jgi:hypothetical protein
MPATTQHGPTWKRTLGIVTALASAFGIAVPDAFGFISGALRWLAVVGLALLALWALGVLGALRRLWQRALKRWGYVPRHRYDELATRTDGLRQKFELSMDLQQMAQNVADEQLRVRECLQLLERGDVPRSSVPYELSTEIEWFENMSNTVADQLAGRGLADRAPGFRVRRDVEGHRLYPSVLDETRLESLVELLNAMTRYRDTVYQLAREIVRDAFP